VVAALGLAFLVRRHRPGAGLIGGALAMLGLMCFASIIALDGFTWGVLGEVGARTGDITITPQALHDVQQSEWSLQYYVPALSFAIGMALLAVTAARSGAVPAWAGWLLALGAVLTGTEGLVVSNAYYVLGAAVMLVAGAGIALALWRTGDEEFAGGPGAESAEAAETAPDTPVILP
jgi:hypothetical protein